MRDTLAILLQLESEGLLAKFAVGGAIAASFYLDAVATEDLDVFAFLRPSPSGLLLLTPLYDRLKELGFGVRNEHVLIHGWPVQILPTYTPLVEDAVLHARPHSVDDLNVPVVGPEYLAAIALQTGRGKDYARVHALLQDAAIDQALLQSLITTHALEDRWAAYVRRYR